MISSNNKVKDNLLKYNSIKDLREDERPREKLMAQGSETLTDSELLAILINAGTKGYSALDSARALLDKFGNLKKLANAEISQLTKIKGIGTARAITLKAAFELAQRVEKEAYKLKDQMSSPELIAKYFIPKLRNKQTEGLHVILLNRKNQIIKELQVSEGTVSASLVHPREVYKPAIIESASSIVLLHNHPSGDPAPSKEDIAITKNLILAGEHIDIKFVDHIIVAGNKYISMLQLGYI